ncbi:MAG: hypothetical protein OXP71_15055 [Candidatus Poribacteria bacterium]|nr:hypothetical protein [Candidatus Poribacteria bacterium]
MESVDFEFFINTQPPHAAISANLTEDVLKVFVDSNKRFAVVPSAEILPLGSSLGYSLNLNPSNRIENGTASVAINDYRLFRYHSEFRIVPPQSGFSLSAVVQPSQFGADFQANNFEIPLFGYSTDQNRPSGLSLTRLSQYIREQMPLPSLYRLYFEDGPHVVLFRHTVEPDFKMTLRSQSGSEQNLAAAQNQYAMQRCLLVLPPVYTIEAKYEEGHTLLWIYLPFPRPSPVLGFSNSSDDERFTNQRL